MNQPLLIATLLKNGGKNDLFIAHQSVEETLTTPKFKIKITTNSEDTDFLSVSLCSAEHGALPLDGARLTISSKDGNISVSPISVHNLTRTLLLMRLKPR